MHIGIFTYGTRGDVQPYIALALGLKERGHQITLAAPENFKAFVEDFGLVFHPLYGDVEHLMNTEEGLKILQTENTIRLMQYFFKVLYGIKEPLRKSYEAGVDKVEVLIVNSATLPIVSALAERHHKKMALTYFMPPIVPTREFPMGDFDFFKAPWYYKLTYQIALDFYWRFVRKETNEYRKELGLSVLKESLITHINRQKPLDLYCLSPSLIPEPKDWESHHKITGFLTLPDVQRKEHFMDKVSEALTDWLAAGTRPVYMGFGSNGIGNAAKFVAIIKEVLDTTQERVLFCTGWGVFESLPKHPNLFVTQYVNHESVLFRCKVGVFHGGAGTLAAMLRHHLPLVIVSFYTDQPTWGKIVEKKKLGFHIPVKKLTAAKLLKAIQDAQIDEIKKNVRLMGEAIIAENGLARALDELERYFNIVMESGVSK